jgi:hypothetical protein
MKITIVGGGLSGLATAYYLSKKNPDYNITLYEKNQRFGGRCRTTLLNNLPIENGCEFIDEEHKTLLNLVKELNLQLEKVEDFKPICLDDDYNTLSLEKINKEFIDFYESIKDKKNTRLEDLFTSSTSQELKSLIINLCSSVFGGSSTNQSSDNFLRMVEKSYPNISIFSIYGQDAPKYRIQGGNQTLISTLIEKLSNVTFIHGKISNPSILGEKVIMAVDYPSVKDMFGVPVLGMDKVYKINLLFPEGTYPYTDIITTNSSLQSLWFNKNSLVTLTTEKDLEKIKQQLSILVKKIFDIDFSNCSFFVDEWKEAYPYKLAHGEDVSFDKINSTYENIFFVGDWTSIKYQGYINGAVDSAHELVEKYF